MKNSQAAVLAYSLFLFAEACSETGGGDALDFADASRAAALVGSCSGTSQIGRFADGLLGANENFNFDISVWGSCLANKTNGCDGVAECTGLTIEASSEDCGSTCSGNVVTGCDDGRTFSYDCSIEGEDRVCVPGQGCELPATGAPVCDSQTFVDRCEDNHPVWCGGNEVEERRPACSNGTVCEVIEGIGTAYCVGSGAVCDTGGSYSSSLSFEEAVDCVDDTKLEVCFNGKTHVLDCAAYADGYSCQKIGSAAFCGVASECIPFGSDRVLPTCDGDNLSYCAAGKLVTFDCKALGFPGCEPVGAGGLCGPI